MFSKEAQKSKVQRLGLWGRISRQAIYAAWTTSDLEKRRIHWKKNERDFIEGSITLPKFLRISRNLTEPDVNMIINLKILYMYTVINASLIFVLQNEYGS
jgi:hypothetical protein